MVLAYSDRIPRVPPYSGYSLLLNNFTYGAFTLSYRAFQHCSVTVFDGLWSPSPRTYYYIRFGLFRFRSPLLSESLFYFLFLRVIRCFSSPGSLHHTSLFSMRYHNITHGEFPHSDIYGYIVYVQLTVAFRSLSRPSSAPCTKASSLRSL